mmetsp:Transcript_249/g.369  ORF Transcript_249/g.369 Transcript_249/m.369 type:complete len:127 (-) Transcript_249:229-609(-)
MKFPDENGEKLTKKDALAWTYLFAMEDLWVLSIDVLGKDTVDQQKLVDFKKKIAELMYKIAMEPEDDLGEIRWEIMDNFYKELDIKVNKNLQENVFYHFSDKVLHKYYDTFLDPFSNLDNCLQHKI